MIKGIGGALSSQQREFMGVVDRNLERMRRLIQDLSDLNRMESGRMRFESKEFDLNRTINETVDGLRAAIAGRNQTLTLDLPDPAPVAYADRLRVSQVVGNLLSNAHKYTPDGGELRIEARTADGMVIVDVVDNGLGISAADQKQLFSQFFRAEDDEVREQSGWGLGLSIVKMMVEAQGGQVWFESALRQGSRFSFSVPLAPHDDA
jgi:signal transduction histidine kinase